MPLRENVADCFRGWNSMLEALKAIDREVSGCGPDCSKEFLRLGLNSVQSLARAAIEKATQQRKGD